MKNKVDLKEITAIALMTITVFSILFAFRDKIENWYFGAALMAIIIFMFIYNGYKRIKKINYISIIRRGLESLNNKKRDFKVISKLFYIENHKKTDFVIDDQTWSDLEMNKLFEKMDYTLTTAGEQMLYSILRKPLNGDKLKKREELINLFQREVKLREELQGILYKIGRQYKGDILELIFTKSEVDKGKKLFVNIMFYMSFLSIISVSFLGVKAISLILMVFLINMSIHYKTNKDIAAKVNSITYLSDILSSLSDIKKLDNSLLEPYKAIIDRNIKVCSIISRNSSTIGRLEGIDAIGDYFNVFFLFQIRSYYNVIESIEDCKEELKEIYKVVGEFDALIAVSIYRSFLEYYTEPKFIEDENVLKAIEVNNPLVENSIPNDIYMKDKSILLTGSNMSGKSTFLRTVGINNLMAQTICTCLAKEYETSYFNVITSISPTDDIVKGKSYYLGEAEAVLRILNSFNDDIPTLCIIDEIFRGTNPMERISASSEILKYMMDKNALAIVATHDLELTEILKGKYECYYFSEEVDELDGLKFDYKIKRGVSPTRNAIKLLKYLNYPEVITSKADENVEKLLKEKYIKGQ